MNLGAQKVKAWRRAQHPRVTQKHMARRFGLSMITWNRIECGHQLPPLQQAVALREAGVCDPGDWLRPPRADDECNSMSDHAFSPGDGVPGDGFPSVKPT